ncbi:MAG: lysylphosphatidylglycerol synthase transmembrane domain-containing protein [Anaerolineae bacterium]
MEQVEKSKSIQLWLGVGISILSLAGLFFFIKPAEIIAEMRSARLSLVGISFFGILAFMILRAFRWRFMLNNAISWRQTFHIQNIGYMLTMLLPFRLGDLARAVLIGNVPPVTLAQGVSTMVVERLLDMLFIVTMLPFTLAEASTLPDWMQAGARGSGIAAIGAILVLIVAANQRPFALKIAAFILEKLPFLDTKIWLKRTDELLVGLISLTRLRDGLVLIGYSILLWLPILFSYRTVMQAVNIQPTWAVTGFVVAAAALSIAAPSSPGQIGVFHAGVTAALVFLNQDKNAAASFAVIYHALSLVSMIILGAIGLMGTGATFGEVVATTRQFARRKS